MHLTGGIWIGLVPGNAMHFHQWYVYVITVTEV